MRSSTLRQRLKAGDYLAGTFIKTPSHPVLEVLANSRLDFVVLDAEHSPFDRQALDACLAVARLADLPTLVRVGDGSAKEILWALDAGADGIVVPHVDSVAKAEAVAKAARFGLGGRGFAGTTRWAGYGTRPMADILAETENTVVVVQIEEPAGVDASAAIAGIDGIDALFLGPADISVSYGNQSVQNEDLPKALATVGDAVKAAGKGYMSFAIGQAQATEMAGHGVHAFCMASEHAWIRNGANADADIVHGLGGR
ncbi:MAG: aldolase/citrate lyase family protein [Pseudoprimorskyibacter sp.]|nr:aldolase/citrate lyase family protein [Pseudoprimorskyibacter sp.]